MEPVPCDGCDGAPEKLKAGAPPEDEVPPNAGVELLPGWLAPNREPPEAAGVAPLGAAPPNWNGVEEPLAGPEEGPAKVKDPPAGVPVPELELPAKGLLKDDPAELPPPKAKLKLPEPPLGADPAPPNRFPEPLASFAAGVDVAPKALVLGAVEVG